MDRTSLTKRTTGYLAAAAVAIGLIGASVSACDLTSPSHFHSDSTRGADSTDRQASLTGAELDVALGDLPLRFARANRS